MGRRTDRAGGLLRVLRASARAFLISLYLLGAGCTRQPESGPAVGSQPKKPDVVLYSSADSDITTPVIAAFEKETGIHVLLAGDTEVTKTTGLVQRLLVEKDTPRADVWWSSEPFGTIRLARAGVLEPYTSKGAEESIPGGWPARLKGGKAGAAPTWYGFAQRARVIVYNTDRVKAGDVPRTVGDLVNPRFKGKVGMARPRFGTTGGHMGAILSIYGEKSFRPWLAAMKANGLRLYDGNSAVVRAVATGELLAGLTDTDDVHAGKRNGWPVELSFERNDLAAMATASFKPGVEALRVGAGPLLLPNTVALVKGGPHAAAAKRLMDFLLSPEVERLLAQSDSHNIPVHPDLAKEFQAFAPPEPCRVNLDQVADSVEDAMKICDEVLEAP